MKIIFILIIGAYLMNSCEKENRSYDVYYWKNLGREDPADNLFIGNVKTVVECEKMAMEYAAKIHERWYYRSYICMKIINGHAISKHRFGEPE